MNTTKHILIAGCGDLGLRAAHLLLQQGHVVYGLRRNPPKPPIPAQTTVPQIQWIPADLCQPDSMQALPEKISDIVYCPTPSQRTENAYRAIFIQGLDNLLDKLNTTWLQRIVFISSSAVYGEHHGNWVDENTPLLPLGMNGRVLQEAEQQLHALPYKSIILRLSGLYGLEKLQLLARIRAGQTRVPRHETHFTNRIHIEDAAAAIVHCLHLHQPAPCYLVSDNTPLPIDELYDWLANAMQVPCPPEGAPPAGIGNKRLINTLLLESGFRLRWPDTKQGYTALLNDQSV
ncbi:MAG: NAD-dependent epimerase/dehydratase family protein [Alcaligenaceae bacterium]|nr:NAD-dependent epimerase/dehydratase family protein [Alcaligenaceae bacterium]